jgi:hypothetical protein
MKTQPIVSGIGTVRSNFKGKEVSCMEMDEDRVIMKDGRMLIVKDGKMLPMDIDMTMSDGTKVMTTGAILRPDGTTRQMAEGEAMYMNGEMTNVDDTSEIDDTMDMDDTR